MLTFKLLRRPRRSIIPIEAEPDAAAAHQPPQKASSLWAVYVLQSAEYLTGECARDCDQKIQKSPCLCGVDNLGCGPEQGVHAAFGMLRMRTWHVTVLWY